MRRLKRRTGTRLRLLALAAALACIAAGSEQTALQLTPVREVATGVTLYRVTDPGVLDPPSPISIWLLRLDPARVRLRAALATDEVVGTETVGETASRQHALAAVNA